MNQTLVRVGILVLAAGLFVAGAFVPAAADALGQIGTLLLGMASGGMVGSLLPQVGAKR